MTCKLLTAQVVLVGVRYRDVGYAQLLVVTVVATNGCYSALFLATRPPALRRLEAATAAVERSCPRPQRYDPPRFSPALCVEIPELECANVSTTDCKLNPTHDVAVFSDCTLMQQQNQTTLGSIRSDGRRRRLPLQAPGKVLVPYE